MSFGQPLEVFLADDTVLDMRHDPGVVIGTKFAVEKSKQFAVAETCIHDEGPRVAAPVHPDVAAMVFHTEYRSRGANLTRFLPDSDFSDMSPERRDQAEVGAGIRDCLHSLAWDGEVDRAGAPSHSIGVEDGLARRVGVAIDGRADFLRGPKTTRTVR
jgi:hypothetical protein